MEIYKNPGIYNSPSIYESGAGGGSVIYKNYETDFSEFNITYKYDIPKEGYLTSYTNIAKYEKENGKLKIIAPSGNIHFTSFNPMFYVNENSILNLFGVEFEENTGYSFIWLDMFSSAALSVHKSFSPDKIIFLVDSNLSYSSTMPILYSDSDYKWLETPFNFSQANNIRIEYLGDETKYYINDMLLITTQSSIVYSVNGLNINPREKKYIKISGIKFKQ